MPGLTIKVTEAPVKTGECGGARMVVEWDVKGKTGFVVQHVVAEFDDFHCTNAQLTPPPRRLEYWEAWQVVAGTVHAGFKDVPFPAGAHGHDTFFFADAGAGTRGTRSITGKVKFLEGAALKKSQFAPRAVQMAGILPATERQPKDWTDDGADDHTLSVTWSCCRGHQTAPRVTGTPQAAARQPAEGGGADDGGKPGKAPREMKNAAERALWSLPPWSGLRAEDASGRRALRLRLNAFKRIPLDEIREGVRLYVADAAESPGGYAVPEMSRVFVLNRFLFRVPAAVPRRQARFFGGWHVPQRGAAVDMLWPFATVGRAEALRLAGTFSAYLGAPYDALGEFDWFRRHYPPRWHGPAGG
jgi:hypothetical protein